jgi:hypothetical protein
MRINVQSYNHKTNGERFLHEIEQLVATNLARFGGRITNVEVLLIENDDNPEQKPKGCVIEAKLADHEPVAVRAQAGSLEKAVSVGAEKMEQLLGQSLDETVDFPCDEYVPGQNGPTI